MALNVTQTRNLRHGHLTIKDGTTTTKTLAIPIDEGDLQFDAEDMAPLVQNRGVNSHFSKAVQSPCNVQWTMKFTEYTGKSLGSATPSPLDALRQQGLASGWKSTEACGEYVVDLSFLIDNPCSAAGTGVDQTETLLFADFHLDKWQFKEGKEYNTLVAIGRTLGIQPTATRAGT